MGIDSKDIPSSSELGRRLACFNERTSSFDTQTCRLPLRCPCCGCWTLDERGGYEICPVCFWEDGGQDDDNADMVCGHNGRLSLLQARANYLRFGACEESMIANVRPPRPEELPK